MNQKINYFCTAAVIAALYVVLTFIANGLNLASGVIQIRLSEALTVLPYFMPAAIPGLTIGCLISNWLTGCVILDVLFGTLATFLGAIFSYLLRKYQWLVPIPPIVANTLIIPFVLKYAYGFTNGLSFFMITIAIGEILSCYVLGMLLLITLKKFRFPQLKNR